MSRRRSGEAREPEQQPNYDANGLRRRAHSRIYAGNEPLRPVEPLVPVALLLACFGVWQVRGYFVEMRVWTGRDWGPDWDVASLPVRDLNVDVSWLILGAVACLAVLVRIWWRRREVWGQVPLAQALGNASLTFLLASWFSFDGNWLLNGFQVDTSFSGAVLLATLIGFLAYMVYALATRRWRNERWLCVGVAAIPPLTVWLAVSAGSRLDRDLAVPLGNGQRLEYALPRPVEPDETSYWRSRMFFSEIDAGSPVYYEVDGELRVGTLVEDVDEPMSSVRLDANPDGAETSRVLDEISTRARTMQARSAFVLLPAATSASVLHRVHEHAREHFGELFYLQVVGSNMGQKPRWARRPGRNVAFDPLSAVCFARFSIPRISRHAVLDVVILEDGGLTLAPESTVEWVRNTLRRGQDSESLEVRLRIAPEVKLKHLGLVMDLLQESLWAPLVTLE